jgi:hypothetical protein
MMHWRGQSVMKQQVYDHFLDMREDALRTAFYELTPADLGALTQMTLPL